MQSKYKAIIFDFQGVLDVDFVESKRVLEYIKNKGISAAIGSNLKHQTVLSYAEQYGLQEMVDVIVGIDDVEYMAKPAPEIFLLCATYLQLESSECLVVGDSISDCDAARYANMDFVGIFGVRFPQEIQVVQGLEQIIELL